MNNAQIIVNEMRNSEYTLGDVLKFQFDPSVQFLNAGESYIRAYLRVGEKGKGTIDAGTGVADSSHYAPWMLDPQMGAEVLVKSMRIATLGTGRVLEEITDYNVWCKKVKVYESNETVENIRQLYYGTDGYDVRTTNNLTKREITNSSTENKGTQSNNEIEVFIRLSLSGLLGGDSILPVSLMGGGLELQIQLEDDVWKVLSVQGQYNKNGLENATMSADRNLIDEVAGYSPDASFKVASFDSAGAGGFGASRWALLDNGNVALDGALSTGNIDSDDKILGLPFYNGQKIVCYNAGGAGVVVEAEIDYLEAVNNQLKVVFKNTIDVSTMPNNDTKVWVKMRSMDGVNYTGAITVSPTVHLRQVQYLSTIYKPSPAEIKKYESAINSASGYLMDYKTFATFNNNSSTGSLQVSNLIPCKYSRVYGVFSFWENNTDENLPYKDAFMTPNNTDVKPKRYSYKLNGLIYPNRPVDLSNYQRNREQGGGWSIIQLRELKQAFKDCSLPLRDLLRSDCDLVLARSLTRKPNTFSLADLQGELRSELEFTTNNKNLLHHNVICCIKSIVIKGNDLEVLE